MDPHTNPCLNAASPNCSQPRTHSSIASNTTSPSSGNTRFVLGPNPPQIQLQFLQDEPLPPPSSSLSDPLSTIDADDTIDHSSRKVSTSDAAQVERKDSGYGGSVSRSSSLAAFGRGIRKVFWRTSAKGSLESVVVTEAPVIDCNIPQDVLDHEGWAQDLAQRLSRASAPDTPDAVSAWLGQLPPESAMVVGDQTMVVPDGVEAVQLSEAQAEAFMLAAAMDKSNSTSSFEGVVEELVFNIPQPPPFIPVVSPPTPPPKTESEQAVAATAAAASVHAIPSYPTPPTSPEAVASSISHQDMHAPLPTAQLLRNSLSMEALNKPQPPLPKDAFPTSPQTSTCSASSSTKRTNQGASSLNSLSNLARKMTVVDFGFRRSTGKSSTLSHQPQRPRIQDLFQDDSRLHAQEARKKKHQSLFNPTSVGQRRQSSLSAESLLDERYVQSCQLMTSPEELDAPSYIQVKPIHAGRRSVGFFKSLGGFSTESKHQQQQQEQQRPPAEVLLSHSNLTPEEISREVAMASRSTSLRSPPLRKKLPLWEQDGLDANEGNYTTTDTTTTTAPTTPTTMATSSSMTNRKSIGSFDLALAPPEPLFYNKTGSSSLSTTSLAESSNGSLDSFAIDSSADEWEGLGRLGRQNRELNSKYSFDLKELQSMLYSAQAGSSGTRPQQQSLQSHQYYTNGHSTNTSTGSLSLTGITSSPTVVPTPPTSRPESRAKKEDYMNHRMSGLSPKLQPNKLHLPGKTKPRSKSRLSMAYGGGEIEVVNQAKFDTPEAIARNKEIRKFISQEIYTTELNYLQYLRTIQEVFVVPLEKSLETEKPFIPRSNALFQLLAHVTELIEVSSAVADRLEACVRDEAWSDEESLVGMVFLEVKEPLSIFLMYGQSYVKGMKALRTLLKSKRATTSVYIPSNMSITSTSTSAGSPSPSNQSVSSSGGPRMDKRRSLPTVFSLSMTPNMPSSPLDGASGGAVESRRMTMMGCSTSSNGSITVGYSKPRNSHGTHQISPMTREQQQHPLQQPTPYERFIRNCIGDKETTSRFSLADLLILPIQRVTRYCLLLKDLKRHTDVSHPDYVGLVHALEQVHTLAMATNDVQPSSLRS
ncbi:hypothetical protein BGZ94_006557 [Podila epigama]|nr:hypothetical protein BGZ94_006557 [Podila epigama]